MKNQNLFAVEKPPKDRVQRKLWEFGFFGQDRKELLYLANGLGVDAVELGQAIYHLRNLHIPFGIDFGNELDDDITGFYAE